MPDSKKERAMDDHQPSDQTSVYLLTIFDRYYLERVINHHGGEPILIEVQVSKAKLIADEEKYRGQGETGLDQLYLSMCGGSCKHHGAVPKQSILSISYADGRPIS